MNDKFNVVDGRVNIDELDIIFEADTWSQEVCGEEKELGYVAKFAGLHARYDTDPVLMVGLKDDCVYVDNGYYWYCIKDVPKVDIYKQYIVQDEEVPSIYDIVDDEFVGTLLEKKDGEWIINRGII